MNLSLIVTAPTERSSELARVYAPMSKPLTEICSEFSNDELANIVDFLERAAYAGIVAAARLRGGSEH